MIRTQKPNKKPRVIYLLVTGLVVLAIAFFFLYRDVFHKTSTPHTENQFTKGEVKTTKNSPSTSSSISTSDKNSSASDTATLLTPTGNFVSNHHPNLGGSPAPNSLASVCNTTPGATCTISFTSGDTKKSLPTKTTDSGGAAYWNWTLQSIGLTAGDWHITATASLTGQSKTSADAMTLVVAQ